MALRRGWQWFSGLPQWYWAVFSAVLVGLLLLINAGSKPSTVELYRFDQAVSRPLNSNPNPVAPQGISVSGKPSVIPAKIDTVLRQYNSPAVGLGQAMYDLGLKYGIDPVFETKSIGNIRCTEGYECYKTQGNGAFRKYASWADGTEDWYKLIKNLYIGKWNLTTVEKIVPVYAPAADKNNPNAYIQHVTKLVTQWRN
jgi:hypothetical protein